MKVKFQTNSFFPFQLSANFLNPNSECIFESVVAVAFESGFRLEMYQNDIFFKKSFLTSAHENDLKTLKYFNLK